jgi:hypothetical protein
VQVNSTGDAGPGEGPAVGEVFVAENIEIADVEARRRAWPRRAGRRWHRPGRAGVPVSPGRGARR